MKKILGTCNKCGGVVEIPVVWGGIDPPVPICRRCGRKPKEVYGPIIKMENGCDEKV